VEHTTQAAVHVQHAKVHKQSERKWMCRTLLVILVIVVIIAVPVGIVLARRASTATLSADTRPRAPLGAPAAPAPLARRLGR